MAGSNYAARFTHRQQGTMRMSTVQSIMDDLSWAYYMILHAHKIYWKWQGVRAGAGAGACMCAISCSISMTHVLWHYCVPLCGERTSKRRILQFYLFIAVFHSHIVSFTSTAIHLIIITLVRFHRPLYWNQRFPGTPIESRKKLKSLITHSISHAFDICDTI